MDDVPRLPRASSFERVLFLASLALMEIPFVIILLSSPHPSLDALRLGMVALILGVLGMGGALAFKTYRSRFHQPGGAPYPLSMWRSQLRPVTLTAVLPICAFILAIAIPPTSRIFEIVFPIPSLGESCFLRHAWSS